MQELNEFQKILNENKQKGLDDKFLIYIHHILMRKYGWIPFEEFKNIPITTVFNLLEMISEEAEMEKKAFDKVKR